MFIRIVYKQPPDLCMKGNDSAESDPSFEKVLLINPKCVAAVVIQYIRKICGLGTFTDFDVCDARGRLKGISNLPPSSDAADLFDHRATYYLTVLRHNSETKEVEILPQINRQNPMYNDLINNVKNFLATEGLPFKGESASNKK